MSEPHQPLPIIRKELPRRSARCDEAPPPGLLAGIAQFNTGDYWECHETLEDLWRPEPDHIRYLYQGILQVGVGCYHLRRGNWRGAVNKLRSGIAYLAPSAPTCLGVDVARLRDEAGALLAALDALGPERVGEYDAGRESKTRALSRYGRGGSPTRPVANTGALHRCRAGSLELVGAVLLATGRVGDPPLPTAAP